MKKNAVVSSAIAGVFALGLAGGAAAADSQEKCYGVSQAGKNDCARADGSHSCAGQASQAGDGGEWVYVPTGLCEKIVGGSLEPTT
jgi:uncharacterized membrane protein